MQEIEQNIITFRNVLNYKKKDSNFINVITNSQIHKKNILNNNNLSNKRIHLNYFMLYLKHELERF